MRLPLLLCVTTLAAATAIAQQAGSTSPSSQSTQSSQTDQSSQPGISSQTSQSSSIYSATGRGAGYAGQQHLRSTKIVGAQVKTSSGEEVGRIEDVILNPASGRIDFAVISAENKLAPVPWQLLSLGGQASAHGSTGTSTSTTTGTSRDPSGTTSTTPGSSGVYASATAGQQPTFTLNVDKSKLQAGPSFDRSRWPEMSASWSQRVYSHFGVSATGVGGTGAGSYRSGSSSQGSTGSTIDQGSTGSSSDSSTGKASSDPSKSSSDDKK